MFHQHANKFRPREQKAYFKIIVCFNFDLISDKFMYVHRGLSDIS
jgi:hypothetical protein